MATIGQRGFQASIGDRFRTKPSAAAFSVVVLLCVAFLLRAPTFGLSEIDWDESAFALVAREILRNHWPFTTIFDDKSIVLFLHYAAGFALFGDNRTAFRLIGVVTVTAGAALVNYIAVARLGLSFRWGLFLGICYLLASIGFGGQAVYSEHFVNTYVLLSAALLPDRRPMRLFFSGFAAALAINSNYLAVFVIGGLVAGHAAGLHSLGRAQARSAAAEALCFIAGAAVSSALVLLPIFLLSDPAAYFTLQWRFMTAYVAHRPAGQIVADFVTQGREFLPFLGLAAALAYARREPRHGKGAAPSYYPLLFGGMGAGSVAAVLATNHVWVHYFLFAIPAVLLLVASLARSGGREFRALTAAVLLGSSLMIGAPGLLFTMAGVRDLVMQGGVKEDLGSRLARMAQPRVHQGDTVYSVCAPLSVYQLLHTTPPTKYPMYPQNLNEQYASALGLDVVREIASIFAARPAVIILGDFDRCDSITYDTWLKLGEGLRRNGYQRFAGEEGFSIFASARGGRRPGQ